MSERERLVEEIIKTFGVQADGKTRPLATPENLADFILADRRRIVEPLVEYKQKYFNEGDGWGYTDTDVTIDETLKRAGVNL